MRLRLRLFALAKQRAGLPEVEIELPDGARVGDLKRALAEQHPELADLIPGLLIAVDTDYATDDRVLTPGAEVAAIPPVSGGCPDTAESLP